MATYKVLQDIEAEDKFLGPLTLKQFIFGAISLTCVYLGFVALTRNFSWAIFILAPPAMISGFLAWPWGRDQPTEVWLLAKIRFMFKPRLRIWNQSGIQELVTITVPKKVEHALTNGLTQTEVTSRLAALADTIDSRGWAVKNVNVNLFAQPGYAVGASDRLIDPSSLPKDVSSIEVDAGDDILDSQVNPVAQHLEQLIQASSTNHRKTAVAQMQQIIAQQSSGQPAAAPGSDYWFLSQPDPSLLPNPAPQPAIPTTITPASSLAQQAVPSAPTDEEKALSAQLQAQRDKPAESLKHLRTIEPSGATPKAPVVPTNKVEAKGPMTPSAPPAILGLATNDDLNVATIAREANKVLKVQKGGDEVVVSLH